MWWCWVYLLSNQAAKVTAAVRRSTQSSFPVKCWFEQGIMWPLTKTWTIQVLIAHTHELHLIALDLPTAPRSMDTLTPTVPPRTSEHNGLFDISNYFNVVSHPCLQRHTPNIILHMFLQESHGLIPTPGMPLGESVPAKHNSLIWVGGLCVFTLPTCHCTTGAEPAKINETSLLAESLNALQIWEKMRNVTQTPAARVCVLDSCR